MSTYYMIVFVTDVFRDVLVVTVCLFILTAPCPVVVIRAFLLLAV